MTAEEYQTTSCYCWHAAPFPSIVCGRRLLAAPPCSTYCRAICPICHRRLRMIFWAVFIVQCSNPATLGFSILTIGKQWYHVFFHSCYQLELVNECKRGWDACKNYYLCHSQKKNSDILFLVYYSQFEHLCESFCLSGWHRVYPFSVTWLCARRILFLIIHYTSSVCYSTIALSVMNILRH